MTTAREEGRASGELTPDQHLGNFVRKYRLDQRLTLADVSARAGISRGMLSKIENGQTSASLSTLTKVARALGVTLSTMFSNYDVPVGGAQHVKAGQGIEVVRRGTKRGHTYHLLAYDRGPAPQFFEPFLITITDESEVFPRFEHSGIEFLYMLEGKLEYRHGQLTYVLEPGDSLTFRGETPHGPERLVDVPIRFLTIINYGSPGGTGEVEPPSGPGWYTSVDGSS
jgi:transcriptional regulator with XRE-family HTH domain